MKTNHGKNPSATRSRPTAAELRDIGKRLRRACPRTSHAVWNAPANRADPVRLLELGNKGRILSQR